MREQAKAEAETGAKILWWIAKAVFGVLIVLGGNQAVGYLHEISNAMDMQKLDHQQVVALSEVQKQTVETLKQLGASVQVNSVMLKQMSERQDRTERRSETRP